MFFYITKKLTSLFELFISTEWNPNSIKEDIRLTEPVINMSPTGHCKHQNILGIT